MNKKFIIFGATGSIGRISARLAKQQGNEVVAVVRSPEQTAAFKSEGIECTLFDISSESPNGYVQLLRQVKPDVVIWAAGVPPEHPNPRQVEHDAQTYVYKAMQAVGIRRVVVLSSAAVWKEGALWPDWYNEKDRELATHFRGWVSEIVKAKSDAEITLRSLEGIDWTILRPTYFSDEPAKGAKLGKTNISAGLAPRELVAQVIIHSVDKPGMFGRTMDFLEGEASVDDEIDRVVREDIDTWVGEE